MSRSRWVISAMPFSPLLTESSSRSGFPIQVDFSLRMLTDELMIRTPAGRASLYGRPPAREQCSISKAGKQIGQKPHAFSSGPNPPRRGGLGGGGVGGGEKKEKKQKKK